MNRLRYYYRRGSSMRTWSIEHATFIVIAFTSQHRVRVCRQCRWLKIVPIGIFLSRSVLYGARVPRDPSELGKMADDSSGRVLTILVA